MKSQLLPMESNKTIMQSSKFSLTNYSKNSIESNKLGYLIISHIKQKIN